MMRLFPGLFNDAFDDMMHDHNMMKLTFVKKMVTLFWIWNYLDSRKKIFRWN